MTAAEESLDVNYELGIQKSGKFEKLWNLGKVLTGDRKYDTEIQTHIAIAKYDFQNLSQVLRNMKLRKMCWNVMQYG